MSLNTESTQTTQAENLATDYATISDNTIPDSNLEAKGLSGTSDLHMATTTDSDGASETRIQDDSGADASNPNLTSAGVSDLTTDSESGSNGDIQIPDSKTSDESAKNPGMSSEDLGTNPGTNPGTNSSPDPAPVQPQTFDFIIARSTMLAEVYGASLFPKETTTLIQTPAITKMDQATLDRIRGSRILIVGGYFRGSMEEIIASASKVTVFYNTSDYDPNENSTYEAISASEEKGFSILGDQNTWYFGRSHHKNGCSPGFLHVWFPF